jgi:hypothetical protein
VNLFTVVFEGRGPTSQLRDSSKISSKGNISASGNFNGSFMSDRVEDGRGKDLNGWRLVV